MRMEMIQELNGRVMKIALEEERDCFGTEMLRHNPVKGLLGACIHSVDQCPLYLYDVGDRVLLSEYYRKKECTLEEWKGVLYQLVEILERAADYFLTEQDILLQVDALFYDEREQQVYALYLDGYKGNVAKGMASLLEDFMNVMNHRDRKLVFFVYGLHGIVKDSNFTLNRLKEYLEERADEEGKFEELPREEEMSETIIEKKPEVLLKDSSEEKGERRKKLEIESDSRWKAVLILAIGAMFLIIALKSEMLLHPVTKEPDIKKGMFFFGVLVVAEGIALYRECNWEFGKRKALLMLTPLEKGNEEICIVESPCYIGSNPERAGKVIDMAEISPVHIKIVVEEEKAYIIDQESEHGTWKNDKQLIPWERNVLQHGDSIQISSIKYKVTLP